MTFCITAHQYEIAVVRHQHLALAIPIARDLFTCYPGQRDRRLFNAFGFTGGPAAFLMRHSNVCTFVRFHRDTKRCERL